MKGNGPLPAAIMTWKVRGVTHNIGDNTVDHQLIESTEAGSSHSRPSGVQEEGYDEKDHLLSDVTGGEIDLANSTKKVCWNLYTTAIMKHYHAKPSTLLQAIQPSAVHVMVLCKPWTIIARLDI